MESHAISASSLLNFSFVEIRVMCLGMDSDFVSYRASHIALITKFEDNAEDFNDRLEGAA